MSNVQSPGSPASKGSNISEQDSMQTTTIPDAITNFLVNNYGNNCVADVDAVSNSAGSVDGLGRDDMDEIDTNNMAIYSRGTPLKRDNRTGAGAIAGPAKREPIEAESATMSNKLPKKSQSAGDSLLIPSKPDAVPAVPTQDVIDADMMLNVLTDQTAAGPSGNVQKSSVDPLVAQNVTFDDTSKVVSVLK